MNFLADMAVSMTTVRALRSAGHHVTHLREEGLSRMPDPDIVTKAGRERRIILTFDRDFDAIMALTDDAQPSVILFRMKNQTPQMVTLRLIQVIAECEALLAAGAFVTIEDKSHRLWRLPIH